MLKDKKGVTLTELIIVMALIAIVVALIVTFVMLINGRLAMNKGRDAVLNDLSNVENAVRKWVLHYDNSDYVFVCDGSKVSLIANDTKGTATTADDTPKYTLRLSEDKKSLLCGGMNDVDLKTVTDVHFDIVDSSDESAHKLIYCEVFYNDPDHAGQTLSLVYVFTTHAQSSHIKR